MADDWTVEGHYMEACTCEAVVDLAGDGVTLRTFRHLLHRLLEVRERLGRRAIEDHTIGNSRGTQQTGPAAPTCCVIFPRYSGTPAGRCLFPGTVKGP